MSEKCVSAYRNFQMRKISASVGYTVLQYYAMLGGERYVDLGLGTHRVKCRVHLQFRFVPSVYTMTIYRNF